MPYKHNISIISNVNAHLSHVYTSGILLHTRFNRNAGFPADKLICVQNAVRMVAAQLPKDIRRISPLTVMIHPGVICEACWWPEGPTGERVMFVGDKIFDENPVYANQSPIYGEGLNGKRGIADQLREADILHELRGAMAVPGRSAGAAVRGIAAVVHELGHFLHGAINPGDFWRYKSFGSQALVAPEIGMQVSGYATKNPLEFVAEVFTGLIFGLRYSENVIAQYHGYGGFYL